MIGWVPEPTDRFYHRIILRSIPKYFFSWVLLVSGLVRDPYYFVIASDFGAFGATDTLKAATLVAVFAIPAVLGAGLMLIPQRGGATPKDWRRIARVGQLV